MPNRRLRRYFDEDIIHDLMSSSQVELELESEWQQLNKDRDTLRTTFPKGNNRVSVGFIITRPSLHVQGLTIASILSNLNS